MRKLFLFTLFAITSLSLNVQAGEKEKNICDKLISRGATKEEIKTCFDAFGKSDYREQLEKEAKKRGERIAATKEEEDKFRAEKEAERKKYIIKKFEGDELTFLYSHFVAVKYTDQEMGKDETVDDAMTSPKELCQHLGFKEAVSDKEGIGYKLSERIDDYKNLNYMGIYVNWQGKKKEFKWDDSEPAAVKHYTAIICKRRRKKDETVQTQEIQDAIRLINEANSRTQMTHDQASRSSRDNSSRRSSAYELRRAKRTRTNYDQFTHEEKKGRSK